LWKPPIVVEFDSCRVNVRKLIRSQVHVTEVSGNCLLLASVLHIWS